MNKLIIVGNICRDIELKYSQSGKAVARFSVAAQRKYKNAQGQYESDYIPCVAFEKSAEFINNYFKKGSKICISGHLQSGSYEGRNGKVYTLDCYVDEAEFCDSKGGSKSDNQPAPKKDNDDFMNIPEGIDEELPFA